MLFAFIEEDGTLVVRGYDPLEKWALNQWSKQNGTPLGLRIETGEAKSIQDLIRGLGKDIDTFKAWYREQSEKAVIEKES